MSVSVNRVRRGFYMDSVALMRHSRAISEMPDVEQAALMIGSATNKALMEDARLLSEEGRTAGANDLVIAVRAKTLPACEAAVARAETLLNEMSLGGGVSEYQPRSLDAAIQELPGANLVLISVPGEFAAAEARKALRKGLHVMLFSDNVPLEAEVELKLEARKRGLLVMGPDCGTAIVAGAPLGFANVVPRGSTGIVGASGTGVQEAAALIARHAGGISHAIGVGGRDLKEGVGGIMTLMAIDALDRDPMTEHVVLISKPPAQDVARTIISRIDRSRKHFTVCFLGLDELDLPRNATLAPTLTAAAENVIGRKIASWHDEISPAGLAARLRPERQRLDGYYSGGTLCAEAQVILRAAGFQIASNAPIPGASAIIEADQGVHRILDLGADEYTVGRPHPMIEPAMRNDLLKQAIAAPDVGIILLDLVLGFGAHEDPAGSLVAALAGRRGNEPIIISSVTGTEEDPQGYSAQVRTLESNGVLVAPSNARAVELAATILGSIRN